MCSGAANRGPQTPHRGIKPERTMQRRHVNRSSSHRAFKGRANKISALNKKMGLRGGIRL